MTYRVTRQRIESLHSDLDVSRVLAHLLGYIERCMQARQSSSILLVVEATIACFMQAALVHNTIHKNGRHHQQIAQKATVRVT